MKPDEEIQRYLENNGVSPFWVESAMAWIRRGLAGNTYFITEVSKPRITVVDDCVTRFSCDAVACVPGAKPPTIGGRLTYTFRPKAKKAHAINFVTR